MKPVSIFLLISTALFSAESGAIYTLDSLHSLARQHYPQTRQLLLIAQNGTQAMRNVNTNFAPKVTLSGSVSYQSEVSTLNLPPSVPISFPESPKNNGKAGVEITQLVTDFGMSRVQRQIEQLNTRNDSLKVETDLFKIYLQINSLFTDIAIAKENAKILLYTKTDLEARRDVVITAVKAGTSLASVSQELDAEILGINEKMIENTTRESTLYSTLSRLINVKIDTASVLELPQPDTILADNISARPDYRQLEIQKQLCDKRIGFVTLSSMPRLSIYGSGYYGRPGMNVYDVDMHYYGVSGVNLTWPLGGNYSNIPQKRSLVITKNIIDVQKSTLQLATAIQLSKLHDDIAKLKNLLTLDDQIATIRTQVKNIAIAQYESGAITTADYIAKLDAESAALANKKIHLIQLTMAYVEYTATLGKTDWSIQ
jgi:outer membrane protein TolC